MKYLIVTITTFLLLGCNAVAVKEDQLVVTQTGEKYYQLNDKNFDRFVVKSRNEFTHYSKLHIQPVETEGMRILTSRDNDIDRSWIDVSTEDLQAYTNGFAELAKITFDNSETHTLSSQAGAGTLNVQFKLLEFRPYANRHGVAATKTAVDEAVKSFGELKYQAVLTDSLSGEIVAIAEDGISLDTRHQGLTYTGVGVGIDSRARNTLPNQRAAWRRAMKAWLTDLKEDLNDLSANT